jgi:ABC-2 type transport system ATP-binding protein
VTVLKSTEYALKLQVDTGVAPIESVMVEVLKAGSVADIAIEDPPLEEVIAHIYNETSAPVEKAEKVTEP